MVTGAWIVDHVVLVMFEMGCFKDCQRLWIIILLVNKVLNRPEHYRWWWWMRVEQMISKGWYPKVEVVNTANNDKVGYLVVAFVVLDIAINLVDKHNKNAMNKQHIRTNDGSVCCCYESMNEDIKVVDTTSLLLFKMADNSNHSPQSAFTPCLITSITTSKHDL